MTPEKKDEDSRMTPLERRTGGGPQFPCKTLKFISIIFIIQVDYSLATQDIQMEAKVKRKKRMRLPVDHEDRRTRVKQERRRDHLWFKKT
jgi:hypothetical protein